MVSLLDIAPAAENYGVEVNGQKVEVVGVSALGIARLIGRFPAFRAMMAGKSQNFSAESMLEIGPEFVAAAIAAGCGLPGDPMAEKAAAGLTVGVQLQFLQEIIRATIPQGVGPFLEALTDLLGTVSVGEGFGAGGKGPVTKSPLRSKR